MSKIMLLLLFVGILASLTISVSENSRDIHRKEKKIDDSSEFQNTPPLEAGRVMVEHGRQEEERRLQEET